MHTYTHGLRVHMYVYIYTLTDIGRNTYTHICIHSIYIYVHTYLCMCTTVASTSAGLRNLMATRMAKKHGRVLSLAFSPLDERVSGLLLKNLV